MEKKTLQEHVGLLDEVFGLVLVLAGNLQLAEGAIQGTDIEKDYNPRAVYWGADEVLAVLHRLQILKADIQGELQGILYAEKNGNTPGRPQTQG